MRDGCVFWLYDCIYNTHCGNIINFVMCVSIFKIVEFDLNKVQEGVAFL